eukprot:CAMPEP_0177458870 /NCGR_PEP_ID=MMETSP0369-20130122/13784_1 /TAXON_ID=447022 ORGANISM="Scrippsiella hangoei-like, Strain SHHI-4" /NCGR_SAMPLE_ID=MMETSP0369 /ASSEMBLY_ACC=CAM_ASM_000364 /LENGTH=159 /DNA_ID=CAMNT_0018932063 /DNA_START=321 /DNA_END=798 /DNA_ORIENTATION=+
MAHSKAWHEIQAVAQQPEECASRNARCSQHTTCFLPNARKGLDHSTAFSTPDKSLETDSREEAGIEDASGEEEQWDSAKDEEANPSSEVEGEPVPIVAVQETELDLEEDGQDGLQHPRHNAGIAEVLELDAVVERDLGRCVEAADDDVAGKPRQTLHRG